LCKSGSTLPAVLDADKVTPQALQNEAEPTFHKPPGIKKPAEAGRFSYQYHSNILSAAPSHGDHP
jgi:hypothetical protein